MSARGARVLAAGPALGAAMSARVLAASVPTRYGMLSTTEDGDFAANGHRLPHVIGSHHLDFVKVFHFRTSDAVLLCNTDLGTSAEAMYYLISL